MRNTLLILFLWPALCFAEYDIKSLFLMPKQMDSNLHVEYGHTSIKSDYLSNGTKVINRERGTDLVNLEYHFGLFDDLSLVLKLDKETSELKDTYVNNTRTEIYKYSGFSDPTIGALGRIKNGSSGSTIMDVIFDFTPGILTREEAAPKILSTTGYSDGRVGNVAYGGHVVEGGVRFGKPMKGDWEWQTTLLYQIRLKADLVDLADGSRDRVSSRSDYSLAFKAQKFLTDKQSTVWSQFTYTQSGSYSITDSTGTLTQFNSDTFYGLELGARTSLLWKNFFVGISGGVIKQEEIEGVSNGIPLLIKPELGKIISLEFLTKI